MRAKSQLHFKVGIRIQMPQIRIFPQKNFCVRASPTLFKIIPLKIGILTFPKYIGDLKMLLTPTISKISRLKNRR